MNEYNYRNKNESIQPASYAYRDDSGYRSQNLCGYTGDDGNRQQNPFGYTGGGGYGQPSPLSDNPYLTLVNLVLVAVNVAVFFILSAMGDTQNAMFMYQHGAMIPEAIYDPGQWYRLLTSTFLHFGLSHLVNNMVMMILLGSFIERALGKIRYLIFYLACGIGSSVVSSVYMLAVNDPAVSGGASGAIFGIIGALLYIILRHKGHYEGLSMRRFLIMLALSLYFGFRSVGVDNAAHLGGLAVGFLLAILLYRMKKDGNGH